MRSRFRGLAACAALVFWLAGSAAWAKEEEVPLEKLPKAVVDAVKAKFPGARLLEAYKETEDGKTTYEVGLEHKGQEIDVTLTPAGKIVEVETRNRDRRLTQGGCRGVEEEVSEMQTR